MSVDFDKALQAPLQEALGEDMTFTPPVGEPVEGRGIYDENYLGIDIGTEADVSTSNVAVSVRAADFDVAPDKGWRVTARGAEFEVIDARPDGEGGIDLILSLTA